MPARLCRGVIRPCRANYLPPPAGPRQEIQLALPVAEALVLRLERDAETGDAHSLSVDRAVPFRSPRQPCECATSRRLRAATPGSQTCSAGIAVWDGREHPDALIRRADEALYAAKAAGRDRATVAA